MKVPDWYAFVLLGIAAWRTFNLLAHDKILEGARRRLTRLPLDWGADPKVKEPLPEEYRVKWAVFINCEYCFGFWIWAAWFAAYEITQKPTLIAAALMAGNAIVVALAKVLTPEE